MHELRHSAADNLWRKTRDIMDAKQLLRHRSVGTTEAYLPPSMDDLKAALRSMGDDRETKWSSKFPRSRFGSRREVSWVNLT
jgi:integrase